MMQDHAYQTPVRYVTDMTQRLIDTWHSLSQSNSIVDDILTNDGKDFRHA